MEVWRAEVIEGKRPPVLSGGGILFALVLHLVFFALFMGYAWVKGFLETKEKIIPIDLTVVVNENLDGEENEPPPLQKVEPPKPPPPKPKVRVKPKVKEPEPPKALEQIVTNIVRKLDKKEEKKPTPEKEPPKKEKPKEPEPPKKTAKELRAERLKKMRESAKKVNKKVTIEVKNQPSGNGRTARKTLSDAEIRKLLEMGYKAGTSEQLAASDEQLGYSLIKMAVEAKWDTPPWTDTLKPMTVRLWFGAGGRIVKVRLEQSSGDRRADQTIHTAASRVGSIPGLPAKFIEKYRTSGVPCRFTVRPD